MPIRDTIEASHQGADPPQAGSRPTTITPPPPRGAAALRASHLGLILVGVLSLFVSAPRVSAQLDHLPYGILLMAHGGTDDWNRRILDLVESSDAGVPVEIAFGMADRATLQQSVRALEDKGVRRIAVVRLFISGESFLQQTRYLLGLDPAVPDFLYDSSQSPGMHPVADPSSIRPVEHGSDIVILGAALADAELSGRILAERALRLSNHPERETVVVIAHGMGDEGANARLTAALEARAATIRAAAPFRRVAVVTLREDWDEARAAAEGQIRDMVREAALDGGVLVIPFRVAGFGPYADVLDGLEYTADGLGLLPHPAMSEWFVHSAHHLACTERWITTGCDSVSGPTAWLPDVALRHGANEDKP